MVIEVMRSILELKPKKIAIFRALQLGDMMCAIPAIRALKNALPDSEITLIGLSWAEKFVQRYSHYFSDFIKFPGYPGLPEQGYNSKSFVSFIDEVTRHNFDLIIQMHGDGSIINPMIQLFGGKISAGYCKPGAFCATKDWFVTYPDDLPEVERHLLLMKSLGVRSRNKSLEIPIYPEEEIAYKILCRRHNLKAKGYVCIHPGARDNRRWWGPEKFSRVADAVAHRGYTVVLTGTESEKNIVKEVEELMEFPCVNMAGKTHLGVLAAMIRNAKMIVSNDTGVSHIAAAMKTPSIIIFLASDPNRWAPLDKKRHHIILPDDAANLKYVMRKTEMVLMDEVDDQRSLDVELRLY
jgi:ADP-heptose:LPS heptosyltransferase